MIHHTTDRLKVRVYFNLHRKCFSIMAAEGPAKGKVVAHADDVILSKVTSKVNVRSRDRVRRTKRKEVHAYVCGELMAWTGPNAYATEQALKPGLPFPLAGCWDAVDTGMSVLIEKQGVNLTYNPYTHDDFKLGSGASFIRARYALLSTVLGRKVLV
jgi:hypothetical protein